MWRDIKCKDYIIIRFNQRPNKDAPFSILMENARKFADFKWKFIAHLTNKERNVWKAIETPIFTQDRNFLYKLIPKLG